MTYRIWFTDVLGHWVEDFVGDNYEAIKAEFHRQNPGARIYGAEKMRMASNA